MGMDKSPAIDGCDQVYFKMSEDEAPKVTGLLGLVQWVVLHVVVPQYENSIRINPNKSEAIIGISRLSSLSLCLMFGVCFSIVLGSFSGLLNTT